MIIGEELFIESLILNNQENKKFKNFKKIPNLEFYN